jgi:methylmalonyl-CoA mutase C-terminal domain/subunit
MVVATAVQEDADAIGVSMMSGAHMTLMPRIVELLAQHDAGDVIVFGGGIIPDDDKPLLAEAGVRALFTPGAPIAEIVDWIKNNVKPRAPLL